MGPLQSASEQPTSPDTNSNESTPRPRILVADADDRARQDVERALQADHDVATAGSGAAALTLARHQSWDLVIAEVGLPQLDGFALLRELHAESATRLIPVILISPRSSAEDADAALTAGAVDYLAKPIAAHTLRARVAARLAQAQVTRQALAAALGSERRMRLAMDAGRMFSWEIDLLTEQTRVSGNVERVVGFHRDGASYGLHETIDALIHPDDRASVRAAIERACHTGSYHLESRLLVPGSAQTVWVESHGTLVRDESGRPVQLIGVTQNIAARREFEAALAAGREQLQLVTDSIPSLISYVDAERRYRWCNHAYTQWFGMPVSAIVGKPMRDVVGEAAWQTIGPRIEAAFGGERVEYQAEARYETGPRWVHAVYTPHVDPSGTVVGVIVLVHDVTEAHRSAEVLRESASRFDLVRDGAEVGFWFCDLPFDKLIWDNRVKQHFWLPPDAEVTIDTFYERLHPDDREPTRAAIAASIADRTRYSVEYRTVSPAGDEKWIRAIGRTFYDAAGRPVRFDGVTLDITERRRMEDAIRESEARFRNMADHAPVMIWMTDPAGNCTFLSESWYAFSGQTPATGLGLGWLDAAHPDDREPAREAFLAANARHAPFRLDYRLRRADGSYAWAIDSATPRFGPKGEFLGYIGSVLDITDRKHIEEALKENDRRKDEFLAMLAHELRNPLAPIRHAAEVLKLADLGHPTANLARDVIERQTQHLTRLVDDLLDVSRIARGRITLRRERVAVAACVERAVEAIRPVTEGRGQTVRVSLPDAPLEVDGDPTRLVQVLSNLLSNASKFSPDGGQIAIVAAQAGPSAVLRVSDHGIGMPRELVPHVFDVFTQADRSLDRSQGGLGIGLTLVRLLVELHGGAVEARSEGPGCGSEFEVRLPLMRASAAAGPPSGVDEASPRARRVRRVLVVEDNADAADMLRVLLSMQGHEVEVATDGAGALVTAKRFQPGVVVCDIGLPQMDGYQVAHQLRVQSGHAPPTLIALSGYGRDEDRQRATAAGFTHHLVKPVEPQALCDLLDSLPD
jgi:PAS domain S-box-containing protein